MSMIEKNLGAVTAYAYAKAGGYTGTEAEFRQMLGEIATTLNEFENFSVSVTTLPAGSSATASYANGVLSLGIPKGDTGDTGDTGPTGADGTTFTPSVSSSGVISWTNDGGKPNPQSEDLVAAVLAALPTWTGGEY